MKQTVCSFLLAVIIAAAGVFSFITCEAEAFAPWIGENGNWYTKDGDTGIPATGPGGGSGLSAYEQYKKNNPGYTGTEEE